tara:strand:- start:3 stop:341 length:339 start_codon:yes stop_codon:yes gene_type:complete
MNEKTKEFVSGLYIYPPNENTAHFIKCKIQLNRPQLLEYLNSSQEEKINLDVKENQDGKFYAEVNTWKADNQGNQNQGYQNQNQGYQNNQNQGNQNQSYNNQGGFNRGYNNR